MNFGDLRSYVDSFLGLDITSTERDALLNEGHYEMCVQSEWTRGRPTITGIAGQADYALPANMYRILDVSVDDKPIARGSEQLTEEINASWVIRRSQGFYWLRFDANGVERLAFLPELTAGQTAEVYIVREPATLVNAADVLAVPTAFHRAIGDYPAAYTIGGQEDNPELRAFYREQFDLKVEELRRLRNSRLGRGPVQLKVSGVHF